MRLSCLLRAACILLAALPLSCGDAPVPPEPAIQPEVVVELGTLGYNPLDTLRLFRPVCEYLSEELHAERIRVEPACAVSVPHAIEMLREGSLDVVIDSPLILYHIARRVELDIRLRRWKGGVASYRSLLVARKDSGISALEQLKGRMVAFEDPWSTSGYFLPAALLREAGLQLSTKTTPQEPVGADEVGTIFTLDEENIVVWVLTGRCAAGAVNNLDYEEFKGAQAAELKVLAESQTVPRQVVAFRRDLPDEVVDALVRALLAMENSEQGRAVLSAFKQTARFDAIEDEPQLRARVATILDAVE